MIKTPGRLLICLSLALCFGSFVWGQTGSQGRYAVFLADQPLATHFSSRDEMQSATGAAWRTRVAAAQTAVRAELATRNIRVTGAVSTLLNAVFVIATP